LLSILRIWHHDYGSREDAKTPRVYRDVSLAFSSIFASSRLRANPILYGYSMSLRLEISGRIARLLIDRAAKRNAFDQAMWLQLPTLLERAVADEAVRLIILQSAEPSVFCAGADIGELSANADNPEWLSANQAAINAAQFALTRTAKPTIALIDGDCIGGGCGLAMACDLRIASARSRFGITPAKLGLVYPLHDTKLLIDLVGPAHAKRILFTGTLIDAPAALRIGLIDEIGDSADDLARAIANASGHSQRQSKLMVRRVLDGQVADDADTLRIFADAFTGRDFHEGVAAFLAKRKADFQ
jgi:enoyl-CoA hydratase/carnithine racemase